MSRPSTLMMLAGVMACTVALTPARAATPTTADTLAQLSWLAGSWAGDTLGVRSEEHWMAPRGGLMVGMHRDVRPGRRTLVEFLRVVADTNGVAYLANPGARAPATRFPLAELGERRVVFANPEHDFPQRIAYWLDGAGHLHARTEGLVNGKVEHEQWRWAPARLADR